MKKISIGILGFGVVGRGTVETLIARQEEVMLKADIEVDIKKICDKSIPSEIPFGLSAEVFTDNAEDLLEDDEISVLVEMIGGVGFSKDFIEKALKKGKHVITANKHLIAKFGNEFFSLAQENNVLLLIEASTAGAIPCIRALRKSLVSLDIKAVKGVLNGTCNFILTRLQNEGGDYADVLRQAQELGYAEADPTFDVEGIDSAHKTAILGAFAFGGEIDFENVKIKGISDLITDDFRFADEIDCNIKLIGSAVKKDGKVYMSVLPTLVKKTSKLGQVHGVMNAVLFEDEFSGPIMMEGHGAGGRATGTAVAADIIEACKHAAK
ncbi:MAG: homoserine dehydrogenase, partial [Candidatus Gracilibacteria bacterium]|nr:homoserine dehydrogenase [Candidatus Gracilibacteria bacterium]